ncbi:MAG: PAS domain S-box protein [Proteobacteria bacterium]|nr:PAS domain S-box protein [Pseudomonadota bacterium]
MDAVRHGVENTENLVRAIAQHAEDTVRTTDAVLVGLVDRVEVDGTKPESLARLRMLLKTHAAMLPQLGSVGVLDENGAAIVTSLPTNVTLSYADRDYFQFHRTHPDRGVRIGTPVRSKTKGEWVVPVSRRVSHRDGSFAGVALANIDMQYFQKYYDTFDIGQAGAILLASADGLLLVRRPFDETHIGRNLLDGTIFRDHLPMAPAGSAEIRSSTDGVVRLYSYRRIDAYPLVVATAIEKDELLADWRADAWRDAIIVAILVVTLGLLGRRLARQVALRAAAQRAAESATEAAAAAAAQYRLLADHSTDLIVRFGLDGVRRYVSPASHQLLGWHPEELVGARAHELVHPEDRPDLETMFSALRAGADGRVVSVRVRRKAGGYTRMEVSFRLVRDAATAAPLEIVGVGRDITLRQKAEDALRESQARLQSILDNAPVAISLKDREHRYVLLNKQYEAWYGVTREQQLGRTLRDVGTDKEFAALMEGIEDRVLATGGVEAEEVMEPDIGTAPQWELVTKFPVRAPDGSIVGVGTINLDITERKAAEDALHEAKAAAEEGNRAKSDFLASMSHEIRTPMNGILGFTDLLLDGGLTEEQRYQATLIKDSGNSLLAIINDILDVSKIESGKLELERIAMSPTSVIDTAISIVRSGATAKGLELRTDLAAGLPAWIESDPTRLRQILLNLLSNAVKFTASGSITVVVSAERGAGAARLRFAVTDTGSGIPPEQQHLLFQNFSQVDRSITRRFGGTGLGLVICKRLVEAMGGAIGVDSEPGRGSTFWFAIALVEVKAPTQAEDATVTPAPRMAGRL